MNSPVIIIKINGWIVVYLRGHKYTEAHELQLLQTIKLGIIIREMGINDINLIKSVFIAEEDVSNEDIIWSFPDKVDELHDEIKNIINEKVL